jgi:hypothetical protein
MVKYQVQYKPINPVNNNPVTNRTLEEWDGAVLTTGGANPNYDMALIYTKSNSSSSLQVTDFKRIESEIWAVYAVEESIKSAMKIAKSLIQQYGIDNVQICKVVQANVDIVFEEEQ